MTENAKYGNFTIFFAVVNDIQFVKEPKRKR